MAGRADTVVVRTLPAVLAALLFASGCAASRVAPPLHPGGPPGAPGTSSASTPAASAATIALSLLGRPYRNGGADPTGFDCSGLVQYAWGRAGLAVPRSVREQMRLGVPLAESEIEAGDLLFFAIDGRTVSHVAIATGPDRFVHAPSTRGVVREERLSADYWRRRFTGARRVTREE